MFSSLNRRPGLPGHESRRRALALLSAIDGAIAPGAESGSLSAVAYMGSLLSMVETILPGASKNTSSVSGAMTAGTLAATAELEAALTLLECVLPNVSDAAISKRYDEIVNVVVSVVHSVPDQLYNGGTKRGPGERTGDYNAGPDVRAAVLKKAVSVLSSLVSTRDPKAWKSPETRAFNTLLTLTASPKPKVRKRAVEIVVEILSEEGIRHRKHVAGAQAAKFVKHVTSACTAADTLSSLHALYAAARFAPLLGTGASFDLISTLMKLPTIGSPMLTVKCFETLGALFRSVDCAISGKNISQTVAAMWELRPARSEVDQTIAFANALAAAQCRLAGAAAKENAKRLPKTVAMIFENFLSERRAVAGAAASCLQSIIAECISDEMILDTISAVRSKGDSGVVVTGDDDDGNEGDDDDVMMTTAVEAIARTFRLGLDFRYSASTDLVLLVNAALFERLGDGAKYVLRDTLQILGDMWDTARKSYREELQLVIGEAVSVMGPMAFMETLPLNIERMLADGDSMTTSSDVRDWLLPLFRDHIRGTRIEYFGTYFLPLSQKLAARAAELSATPGREIEGKTLHIVHTQVWALFPAFCTEATDVAESFPKIARTIGQMIGGEDATTRQYASQGLLNLLSDIDIGDEQDAAKVAAVAPLAKNFLPVLLNAYRAMAGSQHRAYLLQTVSAYARIADKSLTNDVFRTSIRRLLEATASDAADPASAAQTAQLRCDMMDIAISLVDLLDTESAALLFKVVKTHLGSSGAAKDKHQAVAVTASDGALQKRCYAVVERLCKRDDGFLATHGVELAEALVVADTSKASAANVVSTAAKRPRLKVLKAIVAAMAPEASREFIPHVIPEVVLATRESNSDTRSAAFDLITAFARRMAGGSIDDDNAEGGDDDSNNNNDDSKNRTADGTPLDDAALQHYLTLLTALLGSPSPAMLSACLTAISLVIYEFSEQLAPSIESLLPTVLMLFRHRSQVVASAMLSFCKVVLSVSGQANSKHDGMMDEDGGDKKKTKTHSVCDLTNHIPDLVRGAMSWSRRVKGLKAAGKSVVERIARRYGWEPIEASIDESDDETRRMVTYIKKMAERKKRKEKESRRGGHGNGKLSNSNRRRKEFEDILGDTDDEDEGDNDRRGAGRYNARDRQQQGGKRKRGRDEHGAEAYIAESETPVDLLDSKQMMNSVTTVRNRHLQTAAKNAGNGSNNGKSGKITLKETKDGRIIVPDDQAAGGGGGKRRKMDTSGVGFDDDLVHDAKGDQDEVDDEAAREQAAMDLEMLGENSRTAARKGRGFKLKLQSDATASGTTTWASALERKVRSSAAGASGASEMDRATAAAKRAAGRGSQRKGVTYGSEYRARKENTGGDIKLKGKPDPYAFVPLGAPSKRKGPVGKVRDRALAGLVRGGKKGAALGKNTRAKRNAAAKKGGKKY